MKNVAGRCSMMGMVHAPNILQVSAGRNMATMYYTITIMHYMYSATILIFICTIRICYYVYIYIYIYTYIYILRNRTEPAEPNRTEASHSGIGRNQTRKHRTGPSHDASEQRRPNRVEPGHISFRTEPNRTDESSKSGTATNRTDPVPS